MSGASLIQRPRRQANHNGDPAESERLVGPFLRWCSKRSDAQALRDAGIDIDHGKGVLADRYQAIVRKLLGDAGGAP